MQVCRVNSYNYSPANQQQVGFKGLSTKTAVVTREIMQQTFEKAANYGINTLGKDFETVARELIELTKLLRQAREYGFTPSSQELSELRCEVDMARKLFSEAQSYRINTKGKSINILESEVRNARAKANARAIPGIPFWQNRARRTSVLDPTIVVSLRELLHRGPKTKDEAVAALNYLGANITKSSSRSEILRATSRLMKKWHPQRTGGDDKNMKLVTAAKSLLATSSSF